MSADVNRAIKEIANDTGIPDWMISRIIKAVLLAFKAEPGPLKADRLTYYIVKYLLRDQKDIHTLLAWGEVKSSLDFGHVIMQLSERGLFTKEDDDDISHFEGLFETSEIDHYIKKHRLHNYHKTCVSAGTICAAIALFGCILISEEILAGFLYLPMVALLALGLIIYSWPQKIIRLIESTKVFRSKS